VRRNTLAVRQLDHPVWVRPQCAWPWRGLANTSKRLTLLLPIRQVGPSSGNPLKGAGLVPPVLSTSM